MNCPLQSEETRDLLLDYTANRLHEASVKQLELHMASCAACAAFRNDQAAVWSALDAWEPAPVSSHFNRNLWAKIDAAASAPWHEKVLQALRLGSWKPAAPLALAALAIAAGFLLDHPARQTVAANISVESPNTVVAVSASEADQVEETLDDIQLLYQFESPGAAAGARGQM